MPDVHTARDYAMGVMLLLLNEFSPVMCAVLSKSKPHPKYMMSS